ncbi:pentapeptide repeat-containing protein [Micromonospora sp. WMMD1102]|uniref:pentapeptide repeat-containing protein n=1 Tax=Micromonospora sp. WMMD1102 TaxID=3016105 RepID=UPI002414E2BF|nr:pentapeptide repeat-containing protein [Micromonospora sp. WMMD1102]MDG4787155.1 pentapeptide repeat-containing protein [Micromonospora sp. WMMD1102]
MAALLFTARSLDYTAEATNANREQVRLAERGQVTERFSRAIDQLGQAGDDKLAIRLGGIYALERLMRDSPPDEPAVIEVLCAFVRIAAPRPRPLTLGEVLPSRPDVRAAVTVLARRPEPDATENVRLDLTGTLLGLQGIHMPAADLSRAYLFNADLRYADLSRADLHDAGLSRADLRYADLSGADLRDTDLRDTDLRGADLRDADLRGADLRGANLWNAIGLTNEVLTTTRFDDETRLPPGVVRPSPVPTR